MPKILGIIAEDISDVNVLKILAKKITNRKFTTHHHVGKGCGAMKTKIPGWCQAFLDKKVSAVVVVHDLDRNNASDLRALLESAIIKNVFKHTTVVIPIEELESWLLCDEDAIFKALKLSTPLKPIHHPETVSSPKESLGKLVQKHSKIIQKYM